MSTEIVRDLLKELRRHEESARVLATMSLPGWVDYRTGMSRRWGQLADAVEAGLFGQLDAAKSAEADLAAAQEHAAHDPAACTECADQHEAEQAEDYETARDSIYTAAQLDGLACTVCGGYFEALETAVPAGLVIDGGQLFMHRGCAESGASR